MGDTLTLVLIAGVLALGGFVVAAYWKHWQWTGLPAAPAAGAGGKNRPYKTVWDWLQLLGIPVALAALAFVLTNEQSNREQRREDQRAGQQRRRAIDADRESTLRIYLVQMSDLMLDRQLLRSEAGADVRNVARTATLTAVRRLDGPRRGLVVQFLSEARLLGREKDGSARVSVAGADLTGADLRGANLGGTSLRGADLGEALLSDADLTGADLSGAILGAADLRGTDLTGAVLYATDLFEATLVKVHLTHADLRRADLRRADLSDADLDGADVRGARGVDMTGTRGKQTHGP
jgi:uncharacterized protein YjbI with pentapeptide repeats